MNQGYRPRYKEGYFPVSPHDTQTDIRNEMVEIMEACGIQIELHHHEVATAGQGEIDMRFDTLTKMGDKSLLYKYIVKNVAKRHGKVATFMPKPLFADNGSGMHTHLSIWENGSNLFAGDEYAGVSKMCLSYIAGIIKHGKALMALAAPTTNSYKRLVPGYEAPVNLVYSARNRSAACRIPLVSPDPRQKRVEFRPPDPAGNPYLTFAAIFMAGMDGIRNGWDPGPPLDKTNLFDLSPEGPGEHPDGCPVSRWLAEGAGGGPRLPAPGWRLYARRHRNLDRIQVRKRRGPGPNAAAPVRVPPLLRRLSRRS